MLLLDCKIEKPGTDAPMWPYSEQVPAVHGLHTTRAQQTRAPGE